MRIAFSALHINPGKVGGVEQAFMHQVEGLPDLGEHEYVFYVWKGAPIATWIAGRLPGALLIEISTYIPGKRFVAETFMLPWLLLREQVDLIHFPNYFCPPILPCKSLTTIHDLQFRHYPEYFSRVKRIWLELTCRLTMWRSTGVVAISEFVRTDICAQYGHRYAQKIVVVPNAVSTQRFGPLEGVEPSDRPKQPYILCVAGQYPHKNLTTLLRAFFSIKDAFPHRLILVGQRFRAAEDVEKKIDELGLRDRILVTGYIPDAQVATLYRNADLFVFPSLFEGFGLPPVEAMLFGCPTITTRCASLPEVTLGGAHYIEDPLSHTELANRMAQILQDPNGFRPEMAQREELRRRYDPHTIGDRFMDVVRRLTARGS